MVDYLIVGSGLFGATFASLAKSKGKTCLFIEKRSHIAGNLFTEKIENIDVHYYGAHIFRTSDKVVWDYLQRYTTFNNFINSPIANFKGRLFNLPFNMNTFYQLWGVRTPEEAKEKIESQRESNVKPRNLEEQAIFLVGRDIYEILIKGYTEKQWGRPCDQLPASILRRLPVRYTFDNNYFNARFQGVPEDGYTELIERMIEGCEVIKNVDYNQDRVYLNKLANKVIYTGAIDAFFNYCYGPLEYRSLKFEHEVLPCKNFQGVAVMNYTDIETPYTRIIEHKHFTFGQQEKTVITYEYPLEWSLGIEPYYPINDDHNQDLYRKYFALAQHEDKVRFGGRLAEYRYYDMQDTVKSAFALARAEGLL